MLASRQKPIEEILQYLNDETDIFLVGCKGCAEGCESGGEKEIIELKEKLTEAGKKVTGYSMIDMICNENASRMKLEPHRKIIINSDSVLVFTCGSGIQTIASIVDKTVHPGCNTITLGGGHAEWKQGLHCLECGDCVLDYTGGICPVARCSKQLFNGPCGGSVNGKCEVSQDIPCAWQMIVERLTKINKLDKLEVVLPAKRWSVSLYGGKPVIGDPITHSLPKLVMNTVTPAAKSTIAGESQPVKKIT